MGPWVDGLTFNKQDVVRCALNAFKILARSLDFVASDWLSNAEYMLNTCQYNPSIDEHGRQYWLYIKPCQYHATVGK